MKQLISDGHIKQYIFHGLKGRYGHWPANSTSAKRTFVIVYGQHASIERTMSLVEALKEFGDVYIADNPGFGGMESSFKIGQYPDLELYAKHLVNFIDKHVTHGRQLTLFGISYGFQIISETLHRYPRLYPRVEDVVCFVGFVQPSDFRMPPSYRLPMVYLGALPGKTWLGSKLFQAIIRKKVVVLAYLLSKPIQVKFKRLKASEAKRYAGEQADLWVLNDHRTHGATAWDFVKKNNLTGHRIPLNILHLGIPNDHIIDNDRVRQALKVMYQHLDAYDLRMEYHAPIDVDTPAKVRELLPEVLMKYWSKSRNIQAVMS